MRRSYGRGERPALSQQTKETFRGDGERDGVGDGVAVGDRGDLPIALEAVREIAIEDVRADDGTQWVNGGPSLFAILTMLVNLPGLMLIGLLNWDSIEEFI